MVLSVIRVWIVDSTEFLHQSGDVIKGPKLPAKLSSHCITGWNTTHIMVLGGHAGNILVKNPREFMIMVIYL